MKTFIPVYGGLMTIDHETETVIESGRSVDSGIDYVYIAPEDGKIMNKEVHKGDVILAMYGITNENGKEIKSKEDRLIILDKDNALAKYIIERNEMREKIRAARELKNANNGDCCYEPVMNAQEVF